MDKIQDNVVIKVDLDNLAQSASQLVLKKMLKERWRVIATVPVDDNGTPTLIVILAPPVENIKINFPMFPILADVVVMILLFSIFVTLVLGAPIV